MPDFVKLADASMLVDEVRKVGEENPEFNYGKTYGYLSPQFGLQYVCEYVDEDGVGKCIMGVAALRLGIPSDMFDQSNILTIKELLPLFFKKISPTDSDWLEQVQKRQDEGTTWRKAIKKTDEGTK